MKRILTLLTASLLIFVTTTIARAVDIQTVVSPKGVKALLVEDYTVPLIALSFAFKGGSTQDAEGREGTANLLTTLLDEGAGDIKSQAFQARLDDIGMKYRFRAGLDDFSGGITTIANLSEESFETLRLMLNEPRFDPEPIERMKASLLNSLRSQQTDPGAIAARAWSKSVFGDHPYARPTQGTVDSVEAIETADLAKYRESVFARDNLVIGVVGAIDAEKLKAVLDSVFGDLPENSALKQVREFAGAAAENVQVDLAVPQTNIRMALPGLKRDDPDFYAAYLANYILGGGSFSSRLYDEVREKRGLAYGVYSYLATYDHAGLVGAGSATRADRAGQTVEVMVSEMERFGNEGPTEEELEKAKKYIIGSYAIGNLDTSNKIAGVLVAIQQADLGLDYITKRKDYLEAVTLDDVRRVSKRLFANKPTIVTVGQKAE